MIYFHSFMDWDLMIATEKKNLYRKRKRELQRATRVVPGGCHAARPLPRHLDRSSSTELKHTMFGLLH